MTPTLGGTDTRHQAAGSVPAARLAFTDRSGARVVEPGDLELWVGPSCAERETQARVTLTGAVHRITADDCRWTATVVR